MAGVESGGNYDEAINYIANTPLSTEKQGEKNKMPGINVEVNEVQGEARDGLNDLSKELCTTSLAKNIYEYLGISEKSTGFSDNCIRGFIDELIVSAGESIEEIIKNPSMITELISQLFSWETLKMIADEYKQSVLTLLNLGDSDAYEIGKSIAILGTSITGIGALAKVGLKAGKKAITKIANNTDNMKYNLDLAKQLYMPDTNFDFKNKNYAFEGIGEMNPYANDIISSSKKSIGELVEGGDIYSKLPKTERMNALKDLLGNNLGKPSEDLVTKLSNLMRNDIDRISMTEDLFNVKGLKALSSDQLRGVVSIHNTAEGKMFNLDFGQKKDRLVRLKNLGLDREQINVVLDYGVCGKIEIPEHIRNRLLTEQTKLAHDFGEISDIKQLDEMINKMGLKTKAGELRVIRDRLYSVDGLRGSEDLKGLLGLKQDPKELYLASKSGIEGLSRDIMTESLLSRVNQIGFRMKERGLI